MILDNYSTCNIKKNSFIAEEIRNAKLIIWDEAPMVDKNAIEALHRTLQDILGNDKLFGGKAILFCGNS
jgi:ATP-dependent DNA helicase PIF1